MALEAARLGWHAEERTLDIQSRLRAIDRDVRAQLDDEILQSLPSDATRHAYRAAVQRPPQVQRHRQLRAVVQAVKPLLLLGLPVAQVILFLAIKSSLQDQRLRGLATALLVATFANVVLVMWPERQDHVRRAGERLRLEARWIDRQSPSRLSMAMAQLTHDALDQRIAGLHSLERMARQFASLRPQILEYVTEYVRAGSAWPRRGGEERVRPSDPVDPLRVRAREVQEAVTILGRLAALVDQEAEVGPMSANAPSRPLDLSHLDLRRADLFGLMLKRAELRGTLFTSSDLAESCMEQARLCDANLEHAHLRRADLSRADLRKANLMAARLDGAYLLGAVLVDADLSEASLRDCVLERADLRNTLLRDADLSGAMLDKANLEGADLRGARVLGARFEGAAANALTRWPEGFDPATQRVVTTQVT